MDSAGTSSKVSGLRNIKNRFTSKRSKGSERAYTVYKVKEEMIELKEFPVRTAQEENDEGMENPVLMENPPQESEDNADAVIQMIERHSSTENSSNEGRQIISYLKSNKKCLIAIITLPILLIILVTLIILPFKSVANDSTNNMLQNQLNDLEIDGTTTTTESVEPSIKPIMANQYNIHITLQMETNYYFGYVEVIFSTPNEIDHVMLANVANIESILVHRWDDVSDFETLHYAMAKPTQFNEAETLLISFSNKLTVGKYKLCIKYTGEMVSNLSKPGFYSRKSGTTNDLYGTKNELTETDSYNLFTNVDHHQKHYLIPCFNDSLHFESIFNLSLTVPKKMRVHGNSEEHISLNRKLTNFTTYQFDVKNMSLASFGFAVTDLNGYLYHTFRDWAIFVTKDFYQTECVSEIMLKSSIILFNLEEYFKLKFKTDRLHTIVMPQNEPISKNFSDVIIYSENICENMDFGISAHKRKLVEILINSILDQWIGHTFSSVDYTKNEIKFLTGFQWFFNAYILKIDQLEKSNATVYLNIFNSYRTDIRGKHSTTIYELSNDSVKTAVIFFMMENSFTEKHFQNTLFNAFTDENIRMKSIEEKLQYFKTKLDSDRTKKLGNWLDFTGFTIINITKNHDENILKFTSEGITDFYEINKFNSSARVSSNVTTPVTFTTSYKPDFDAFETRIYVSSDKKPSQYVINDNEPFTWVIANIQQCGYYRVIYDKSLWRDITTFLNANDKNHKTINIINRAKLIDDAAHLADAGYMDYKRLFQLMNYLRYETELLPWKTAKMAIEYLEQKLFMYAKPVHDKFKEMMRGLFENYYNHYISEENAEETSRMNYDFAIEYGCELNITSCIQTTSTKYKIWLKETNMEELKTNEMKTIICNALRYGNESEYDFMRMYYRKVSAYENNRKIVLEILGCTRSTESMKKFLEHSLMQSERTNNFFKIGVKSISSNIIGWEIILTFLQEKYTPLNNGNSIKTINMDDIFLILSDKLYSDKYENWFQQLIPLFELRDDTKRKIQRIIAYNKHWMNRNLKVIEEYLSMREEIKLKP